MTEEAFEWTADNFSRRHYVVEGTDLDKARKIELIVKVDGRELVHVQAREPGLLAFVSKPTDQGFEIDMVEPIGKRFFDMAVPEQLQTKIEKWQYEALGIEPPSGE